MSCLQTLLRELWHLARPESDPPEAFLQGRLDIDGVGFTLREDSAQEDTHTVVVYADFGLPPAGAAGLDALRRLMALNLFLFERDAPTFGMNADDGHVLFASRLKLEIGAARLGRALAEIAAYAGC